MITPEQRLWLGVLLEQIRDYRKGAGAAYREAKRFLFDESSGYQRICQSAGIDGDYLKRKIIEDKMGYFRKIPMEENDARFLDIVNSRSMTQAQMAAKLGITLESLRSRKKRLKKKKKYSDYFTQSTI